MPQEFLRRDVQLVVDQVVAAMKSADNIRKLTNLPESVRALSVAITNLETAHLYLRDLAGKTPESQ